MKLIFYNTLLICLLGVTALLYEAYIQETRLIFCDVGQGDAILVTRGNQQMLVDTGRGGVAILNCLEEKMPFWDKNLDLVVLTHPDADHIGGFTAVSDFYTIAAILYVPLEPDTNISETTLEEIGRISAEGATILIPYDGMRFGLDGFFEGEVINPFFSPRLEEGCFLEIAETHLWDKNECFLPQELVEETSKNNLSIGIKMHIEGVDVFLSGDLEEEAELALASRSALHRVDVLKVGHHGAKTSTTEEILEVLQPEISVISVGKNNSYSHPSPRVLQQLEDIGSRVYRTDIEGTVELLLTEGAILRKI